MLGTKKHESDILKMICSILWIIFMVTLIFTSGDQGIAYAANTSMVINRFNDDDGKFSASIYYEGENSFCNNIAPKLYFNLDNCNYTFFNFTYEVTVKRNNNIVAEYVTSFHNGGQESGKKNVIDWSNVDDGNKVNNIEGLYEVNLSCKLYTGMFLIENKSWPVKTISFKIDRANPRITSSVSNGAYTNDKFTIKVSDSNAYILQCTFPNGSHEDLITNSYEFNDSTNGKYSFIAIDKAGNRSETYTVYYDTQAPKLSTDATEYENSPFTIKASDNVAFKNLSIKTPNTSWQQTNSSSYTVLNSAIEGWYEFRALDKAGNQSATVKRCYDKTAPTVSCEIANGGYTNRAFTISVSDTYATDKLYYKVPGASSFTAEAITSKTIDANSGDGLYSFYAVDKAGNQSAIYNVTLETVVPILTSKTKSNKSFVDGSYINEYAIFTVTDSISYSFTFYKRSGNSYVAMPRWNNYKNQTIYFDKRETDKTYNVFFTNAEAKNYIAEKEYANITENTNWNTNVSGTIIDSEAAYAKTGATYWIYLSEGTRYIFFAEARARSYAFNNSVKYIQSSPYYFWEEGSFKVRVTDVAGNYTERNFVIDFTAPTGNFVGVTDGYAKGDFSYLPSDDVEYSYLEYRFGTSGTWTQKKDSSITIYATAGDGTYYFRAYDKAGNVSGMVSVVLDTVEPTITNIAAFYRDGQTVRPSVSDSNFDYVILRSGSDTLYNGASRTWSTSDLTECTYILTVYDKAGNTATATFVVDKTAPTFNVEAFYRSGQTVTSTIVETNYDKATLDGAALSVVNKKIEIPSNGLAEKEHTIVVYDKAGNSTSKSFIVDKTAPSFSNLNDYYSTGNVKPNIADANLKEVKLDGVVTAARHWSVATELTEGTHTLIAVDKAGNSSSKSFIVDKTAPIINCNSFYNKYSTIVITVADNNFDQITINNNVLDGLTFAADTLAEGSHKLIAYDKAKNSTEVSFVVDKTAPSFDVNSYYRTGNVTITITEQYLDYVTIDDETTELRTWSVNDLSEGQHTIAVHDKAGNFTAKSFIVDRTAPVFSVNAFYKAGDTITLNLIEANLKNITIAGKGNMDGTEFAADDFADGTYEITITDEAGNSTTKSFTVDKTAPIFSVKAFYKAGETISLSLIEANLNSITISGKGTVAETEYHSDDFADGPYILTITDKAGNSTSKSFTVDKTLPIFNVNAYYNASEVITLTITELNLGTVTLDGDDCPMSIAASDLADGVHTVRVTDKAGNQTAKSFIVDKTAPIFSLKDFYAANETISLVLQEDNLDRVTLDGVVTAERSWNASNLSEGEHTIAVHDKAENVSEKTFFFKTAAPLLTMRKNGAAAPSGAYLNVLDVVEIVINDEQFDYMTFNGVKVTDLTVVGSYNWTKEWSASDLVEGTHNVTIYDKAHNETSLIFTVDKTAPALTFRLNGSVATGIPYVKANDSLSFVFSDVNLDYAALDGETTTTTLYSAAALADFKHSFVVYDKAGNTATVEFIVDKTAPSFFVNEFYKADDTLTLQITDVNLDRATLDGTTLEELTFGVSDLSEGTHTIVAYDLSGNSTSKSFIVDKTAPSFNVNAYYKAQDIIMLSVSEKYLDYITLNGAVTTSTSWQGADLPDGEHVVEVYDKAGNVTTQSFVVDKTAPSISGSVNGGTFVSGMYLGSNTNIEFAVIDDNLDYVNLNGEVVEELRFAAEDLDEKEYRLLVADCAGNTASVTFVVDKTAPAFNVKEYYSARDIILLSVIEKNLDRVTLDGAVTTATSWQGSELPNGTHTVVVYDRAGNSTEKSFTVDTTAPSLMAFKNGLTDTNDKIYAASDDIIKFVITEANLDYMKLNDEITQKSEFAADDLTDSTYILTVYDKAGNSSSRTFVVDKEAPTVTLRKNGQAVLSGEFFRESATISIVVNDTNLDYVLLDDVLTEETSWRASELYEGAHRLVAYDCAGNSTEMSFIVDKTAPSFEVNPYYKTDETVSLTLVEVNFDYLTLRAASDVIYEGDLLDLDTNELDERTYILTIYDKAGNSTSKSFIVDKTAPIIAVNEFYKAADSIRISITEANLNFFTLDGEITNTTIYNAAGFEDGTHTIIVYDKAGNTATETFVVDKTAPVLPLAPYYNGSQTVYFDIYEENLLSVVFDGEPTDDRAFAVTSLAEGTHTVVLTDRAGNVSRVTFIVDTVAPSFSLKDFYKETDTLFVDISDANLDYVLLDDMVTEVTVWQCTQLAEGEHVIVVYDKAGNSTSKSFIIDKTLPVITVSKDNNIVDTTHFDEAAVLVFEIDEAYLENVTLNGRNIDGSEILCADLSDGEYTLKVVDCAGNFRTWTFVVDKTAPSVTLRRNMATIAAEGAYISSFDTVSVIISDRNIDRTEIDGAVTIVYSWTGESLSDGEHIITAFDKAGNSTTVSFIVHKAAPEFTLKEYYVRGDIIKLDLSEESIDYVLLDNETTFLRSWLATSLAEGIHSIKAVDKAGNETEKIFTVDTIAPTLVLMKNSESARSGIFVNADDTVSIDVEDANLDYVSLDAESTTSRLWKCDMLDEREHVIVVYDKAGNTATATFIVDKTAPSFEVKEYYREDDTVFIDVSDTYLDGIYLNDNRVFVFAYEASSLGEGTYVLTARDKAGNVTEKQFVVDLTAPVLTVSGKDVEGSSSELADGENSFGSITITAIDIASFTLYASFDDGDYTAYGSSISIAAQTASEGTWRFYGEDENGYRSDVITVTLDFSNPTISVEFLDDDSRKGYTSKEFTVAVVDTFAKELYVRHESVNDFSLCSHLEHTIEAIYANEGTWYFYGIDENGLTSDVRQITLDLAAPSFSLDGLNTEEAKRGYTNTAFSYSAADYHFASISYKKLGAELIVTEGDTVCVENTRENEGTWEFFAEDVFGQKTETYTVVLSFTYDFKNIEDIRNSFKQNTWYITTLPARIYASTSKPDISGSYTFASYDTALAFAIEKEREYRVYPVSEGGFGYVSVSNENVYMTYMTDAELEAAIMHYAVKYVSARKIFSSVEVHNKYENLTNAEYESDLSALTANDVPIPNFLADYNLPVYFARQSFVPGNHQALSPSSVKLTYIGNLIGAVEPHEFDLAYGESLSAAMSRASNLYEGYYLYEESDLAGNVERAILFVDLSLPTLGARVFRGDGEENLVISKDTVGERSGVFYALSFELTDFFDNMDENYVSVSIAGEKFSQTFTVGDEIPTLNAEFGSGRYTVTVYDRSYNLLTFTVIIAGAAPSWYYTSLAASSKKLSIYINKNDNNNAIINMELLKIRSDGTYTVLSEDDEGNLISPATLTYAFTTGGKYSLRLVDMYGRTVEMEPIFYEKGLPYGSFSGTVNGGVTNDNVTFTYGAAYGLKAFYLNGSSKAPVSGLSPVYDAATQSYVASFEGTAGSTIEYMLLLYLLTDEGIYIEYSFTIDKEAPLYSITDLDGIAVMPNGSTNKPFFVEWGEDNVVVRCQRDGFTAQNYVSGTMIAYNTLYTFTLRDKVGNEASFTVYLDSEVSYRLSAEYVVLEDGNIISNNAQQVIPGEELTTFSLTDDSGRSYSKDEVLTEDGTYVLAMTDIYGNAVTLIITLDFVAPVIEFDTLNDFSLSNGSVTLTCAEADACIELIASNGTVQATLISGYKFTEVGSYKVRATDVAGNFNVYTFVIDKAIDYTVSAVDGLITTANISFVFSEDVLQDVTRDGEKITPDNRYSQPGKYSVTLSDRAGNQENITFCILPERMQTLVRDLPIGIVVASITKDGQSVSEEAQSIVLTESGTYDVTLYHVESKKNYYFKVVIDNTPPKITITQKGGKVSFTGATKKNVTYYLYKNGELVEDFDGKTVSDKGDYKLVLIDDVGNTQTYEFSVKFTLNTFSILLIAIGSMIAIVIIALAIKGRRVKAA